MHTRQRTGALIVLLLVLPQGLFSCIPTSLSPDSREPQNIPRAAENSSTQSTLPAPPAPLEPGQSYEDAQRRGLVNDAYAVQVAGSSLGSTGDGAAIELQFTVTNAGKQDDEYRVEVVPTGAQLTTEPDPTIALAAGTSTTFSVSVRPFASATEPSVLCRVSSTGDSNAVDETTVTRF